MAQEGQIQSAEIVFIEDAEAVPEGSVEEISVEAVPPQSRSGRVPQKR